MCGMPLRVHIVVGTRPEAIKLAPLALRLRANPAAFRATLIASAQHGQICDEALQGFGLVPDISFSDRVRNDGLLPFSSRLLRAFDELLTASPADLVVVQGDTTTAALAALAAFYAKVPVAHVEAGLRSGNLMNPFPEEANRRVIDNLSTLLLAPTPAAGRNLLAEHHGPDRMAVTGNTVVDALQLLAGRAVQSAPDPLQGVDLSGRRLVLVTTHRRESWGRELEEICLAVADIAHTHSDCVVAVPVHPNPQVHNTVHRLLGGCERVHLLPPLAYLPFLGLMSRASLVLTDSGGVQEEAPSLGVPVLVLRRTTERPEAIEAGMARLVGTAREAIVAAANAFLSIQGQAMPGQRRENPFGDGRACERIERAILNWRRGRTPLLTEEETFGTEAQRLVA